MKTKNILLGLLGTTAVAGFLYLNRGPKTEYHIADIAGVHPSTPGNYKDMAYVYLLDSLGGRKDSMNVEITPQICKQYRPGYDYRIPDRTIIGEFELGEIKVKGADGKDSTYVDLVKMRNAATINKQDLQYWQTRIRAAERDDRPEYLFGDSAIVR